MGSNKGIIFSREHSIQISDHQLLLILHSIEHFSHKCEPENGSTLVWGHQENSTHLGYIEKPELFELLGNGYLLAALAQ